MRIRCIKNNGEKLFEEGKISSPVDAYSYLEIGKEYIVYGITRKNEKQNLMSMIHLKDRGILKNVK